MRDPGGGSARSAVVTRQPPFQRVMFLLDRRLQLAAITDLSAR
jgi:hypothetical protein